MGVMCQILLHGSEESGNGSGQRSVTGVLRYTLEKPEDIQTIDLSFVGKGKCHWTVRTSNNSSHYNKEQYVSMFENIFTERNDDNMLPGTHEYPFKFLLPDNIPASFKNQICSIEYKVKATFVKANFFVSKEKFYAEIPVYGYTSLCYSEPKMFTLKKELFSILSENGKVYIRGVIEEPCVTPGDNIIVRLNISNDSDVPISIRTELCSYFTYTSNNNMKHNVKETVKNSTRDSPVLMKKSVSDLTCIAPTLPSLYSIQHAKIVKGEYKVNVTVKVPFPHINATVEIPVVIGQQKDYFRATLRPQDNVERNSSPVIEDKYDENWYDMQYGRWQSTRAVPCFTLDASDKNVSNNGN